MKWLFLLKQMFFIEQNCYISEVTRVSLGVQGLMPIDQRLPYPKIHTRVKKRSTTNFSFRNGSRFCK